MEKFYRIKEGSSLWNQYFDWIQNVRENNELVKQFCQEHNIESCEYYCDKNVFSIVPTENDKANFGNQFTSKESNDGLRFFKKNSAIGRAWIEQAKNMKFLYKPHPGWLNKYMGRSSSRLFDYQGTLYCSLSADQIGVPDDVFIEIKGSKFYQVIEEMEENANA